MPAINIRNLSFRYKGEAAFCLENINLSINQGDSFGLFGPNGAGKSTLMSLMTGILRSDSGIITVLGTEAGTHKMAKGKIGFIPQDFAFFEDLSPVENMDFFGAWSGLKRTDIKQRTEELLHVLGLFEHRHLQVKKFSGGMKRRVNLAIGVIHKPQLLFLDEPTVGVDVQTRHAIIQYLKNLNQAGTTLIYTSHLLTEAEELCQTVALIDEGKIMANDALPILIKNYGQTDLEGLFLTLTGKSFRD